jgi:hypothetical protein
MAKIDDVITSKFHFSEQETAPDTPSSGVVVVYAKTDGKMYAKDDTGAEVCLGPQDLSSLAVMSVGSSPPAAGEGYRKKLHFIEGGAGEADILKICVKKADDTYDWLTIGLT